MTNRVGKKGVRFRRDRAAPYVNRAQSAQRITFL